MATMKPTLWQDMMLILVRIQNRLPVIILLAVALHYILLSYPPATGVLARGPWPEKQSQQAYVFERPQVTDQADLELLVSACRGDQQKLEKMPYVAACLDFLATSETAYMRRIPEDLANVPSDHHRQYQLDPKTTRCPGETFLYHTYWNGPMTWRVEAFIKAFLQTQNLNCSQLWFWIDENASSAALKTLLTSPLFRQFLPLMKNDMIVVKSWIFPERIPLPSGIDHRDGKGFWRRQYEGLGDVQVIGDKIYQDKSGQQWLDSRFDNAKQVSKVALSDTFRFVTLHLYGGVYLDMDVLLLRDLRPLLTPHQAFAERWGARDGLGDYNTAILRLEANSSLSSYFLRIGTRLDHSFHPLILGDIARKDKRHDELLMLETPVFDPVWIEFDGARQGSCPEPCYTDFKDFFRADATTNNGHSTFFSGAFAYHIHNLWSQIPETGSWFWKIIQSHNEYFEGIQPNLYQEYWNGPKLEGYHI